MAVDAWLPIGLRLPDGATVRTALSEGADWQIYETAGKGRALIASDRLLTRWKNAGLVDDGAFTAFQFGDRRLMIISCGPSQALCPVSDANSPGNKAEAISFALALKATRELDTESPLQDALYIEKITRLLPAYGISSRTDDEVVLGYWLTGGVPIPASSFRRLHQAMSWLSTRHLKDIVETAGFTVSEIVLSDESSPAATRTDTVANIADPHVQAEDASPTRRKVFELAGRPDLAAFFNEHIVDIVLNRERYSALGIDFPSAVILHGPPGCGKTFAVDRLIDYLGWPSFQIDATSVASPYIHETSRKVAQVFEKAMQSAPAVLVIDEMEAFLADREIGTGHHRVEEVAEFLRRIPEAVKNKVLIVAMTNRIDMIDPAIQRRGRFDHVIKVDFASEIEVRSLLDKLLSALPTEHDVDSSLLAARLAGRPLSDVTFVVREGARLAARAGKDRLDQASLMTALASSPARGQEKSDEKRRIGFV
jgi:hypothetical protein